MKIFTFSLAITMLFSCAKNGSDKENNTDTQSTSANKEVPSNTTTKLDVKTYQNDSSLKGWGYDIYNGGQIYIHQPNIPAIPGNRGFSSQQHAKTAGSFAVYKIRNNIMPPTISVEELDSLGVLK